MYLLDEWPPTALNIAYISKVVFKAKMGVEREHSVSESLQEYTRLSLMTALVNQSQGKEQDSLEKFPQWIYLTSVPKKAPFNKKLGGLKPESFIEHYDKIQIWNSVPSLLKRN